MNKIALYIPRPGMSYQMIRQGYVDALEYLGWKVYSRDPKTKLECKNLIERHGVRLILTHSRYGVRQLPIDTIEANQVAVFIEALPLSDAGITIDNPYELAHGDEPDIMGGIESHVVHTRMEQHTWKDYMRTWSDHGINMIHLPAAGNLIKALPPTCAAITDVAMVANFSHRPDIMYQLIQPLFKRLELLGHSYQAFGDDIWAKAGLNYNGPLADGINKVSQVYATALVCPNVHTQHQIGLQALVNERSFMIPLCGGLQVSDNPMADKYLGAHCGIAVSTTDFMHKVFDLIENQSQRFDKIRASVKHVAENHTYFNRLAVLFDKVGLPEFGDETRDRGQRAAVRHSWEMDARLNAEERGVIYEQNTIGAT